MSPLQIEHVRASWALLSPDAQTVGDLFYGALFTRRPQLRPLFKGDMSTQSAKLVQMVSAAVAMLDRTDTLVPVLQRLARSHVGYGVQDVHYAMVGDALIETLARGLGDAFTPAVRSAWIETYGLMARVMIEATREPEPARIPKRDMATGAAFAAAAAVVLLVGGPLPAQAQQVGWHPATSGARVGAAIDHNTFIVGHPASPTVRGGHANFAHPAVVVARRAGQPAIDSNAFIVQPPTAVTWLPAPAADSDTRLAQGQGAAALRH